jgi:DNA primase
MATTTMPAFRRDLLPPARTFYEQVLGKLSRPRRGWSMGRCPFHESRSGKSFSVHVDGAFFCFGCGVKGGDLVAFTRLRERCDFPTACKLLGAWRDVSEAERLKLASEAAKRKQEREQAARAREAEQTRRIELRDEIHTLVRIQAEVSARLSELLQGAALAYENEVEDCWSAMSLALDDLRNCEAEYMTMIGMERAA